MFANMSIKMKLIIAFAIIAILVLISSIFGVYGSKKSAEGFSNYRSMSKNSMLASRVQANMLMVRMNVKDYLNNPVQKEIDEFNSYYKKTDDFIKKALKEIKNPKRAKLIKTIAKDLILYKQNFFKVVEYMNDRNKIVNENLNINGKKIEQLLTYVMKSAKEDGDQEASLEAAESIRVLLLARLYTVKFLESNSKDDSNRVHKEFKELEHELEAIKSHIQNPKRIENLEKSIALSFEYEEGVDKIIEIITKRNEIINKKLNILGPEIAKTCRRCKAFYKKRARYNRS